MPKTWFITGATRGLGLEIAKAALRAGDRVVATGRKRTAVAERLGPDGESLLSAELEFHAGLLEGKSEPLSGCSTVTLTPDRPTFVIGYNEFHNRLGMSLPNTQQWLPTVFGNQVTSPGAWPGTPVDHHMVVYETLTHAADAVGAPRPRASG